MTNREKYEKEILDIACAGNTIAVKNGVPCTCDITIRCDECDLNDDARCDNNLIKWCNSEYIEPVIDWSKVPVDTPIWVRDSEKSEWRKEHFAKYENGKVHAFSYQKTSWSNTGIYCWEYAKLATDDELNKNSILRAYGEKEE